MVRSFNVTLLDLRHFALLVCDFGLVVRMAWWDQMEKELDIGSLTAFCKRHSDILLFGPDAGGQGAIVLGPPSDALEQFQLEQAVTTTEALAESPASGAKHKHTLPGVAAPSALAPPQVSAVALSAVVGPTLSPPFAPPPPCAWQLTADWVLSPPPGRPPVRLEDGTWYMPPTAGSTSLTPSQEREAVSQSATPITEGPCSTS